MIQIECGVKGCPYGGLIEAAEEIDEEDPSSDQLGEHYFLREYLRKTGWIPIMVGVIEQVHESWICPVCQGLLDRERTREG